MLDAASAAINVNVQKLQKQIAQRRKALEYRWGSVFEGEVSKRITGKIKSTQTLFGRAGYRTVGGKSGLVIEDEQAAIAAAKIVCPDAVKTSYSLLKTKLMKYLEETGEELAGTRLETPPVEEKFYVKPGATALPEPTTMKELGHEDVTSISE